MVGEEGVMVITGVAPAIIFTEADTTPQGRVWLLTVYTELTTGLTTIEEETGPVLQVYEDAPPAVSVEEPEGQTTELLAAILKVGKGTTPTLKFVCELQPELFTLTVYVLLTVGDAVTMEPVVGEIPAAGDQE
jgi:hypothetical protein